MRKSYFNKVLGQRKSHSSLPLHFKFVNTGQLLLGIPAVGMLAASVLANIMHISPGGLGGQSLRGKVLLGAIDNFILSLFLIAPFVLTVMHYTAALHAKSICDHVNQNLMRCNSSKQLSPQEKAAPEYFGSRFCCLELHTAIVKRKPIIWTWNQSSKTIQEALTWIPRKVKDLGVLDEDLLPIQEDVQMARPCAERIKSAERELLKFEAPLMTIGKYKAPLEPDINQYFISYEQNDGNDEAVQMLYSQLQPLSVWLDKYANAQDEAAVRAGVVTAEQLIAVLSPKYFDSYSCCSELHTAIKHNKPIIVTWNQSKHTVEDVTKWIPADLVDLGFLNDDLLPVGEDVQLARSWAERIQSAMPEPFTGEVPVKIGAYWD